MYRLKHMEEELNLDELDQIQASSENKLKVKNRFQDLSEKVFTASKERDDAIAKANTEAEARQTAEKEVVFYKDFSVNISKYPNASEYQAQILEKVKGGYSTEDAMISVLAKEGKLNMGATSDPVQTRNVQAEGGSAQTTFHGNKSIQDMTAEEKFSALTEADQLGDLINMLRGR